MRDKIEDIQIDTLAGYHRLGTTSPTDLHQQDKKKGGRKTKYQASRIATTSL